MKREATQRKIAFACALLAFAGCGDVRTSNKPDVGVKVGPLGGATAETGSQIAFVVTLRTQPADDVVIPISSSNPAEATLGSAGQIVFTRDDWQAPHAVTVTGVDDDHADGHQPYEIVFGAIQSADPNYSGLQVASIPGTNLDDEIVGIAVSASSEPTTEAGGETAFTVALRSRPTAIVSVPYSSSDPSEGSVTGQSFEFSPDDWNIPRTITIEGVDDATPDGNQTYAISLGPLVSVDPLWNGLDVTSVLLVNVDDDAPGITVTAPNGATTEAGGVAEFSVQLNSQPSANVILSLASNDDTEGANDFSNLTFTTANWSVAQTVTVTGVDDDAADGAINYQVVFQPAVSTDVAYDGITPPPVDLFNTDDEDPAVTVFPLNGLTTESGSATTFEVVLAAQPANDVDVAVTVSNAKEAKVSPALITFTAADWDVPVTVTVTGKNDFLPDGHKTYDLVLTPAGDATYAALSPTIAHLTNVDDGPPAKVLIYNDNFGTLADEAANALSLIVTSVATQPNFLTELANGPDLVIWEASTGAALDAGIEPALTAWLSSGGRLIYSDTDLDGQAGMQAQLEVTASNPFNVFRSIVSQSTIRGDLFERTTANTIDSPLTGVKVVSGDNGNELSLAVTGTGRLVMGTFVGTTSGAIAVTRDNMAIVNGFAPDDIVGTNNDADAKNDMQELYENEIVYLLDVPKKQWRADHVGPTAVPGLTTVNIPVNVPVTELVKKIRVSFYIQHTNDSDLDIFLVAPDGTTRMEVFTDRGSIGDNFGSGCADAQRTIIDEAASSLIPTSSSGAPFVGTWLPEGSFAPATGMSAAGSWTLEVTDDATSSTSGTVQCWSLLLDLEEN